MPVKSSRNSSKKGVAKKKAEKLTFMQRFGLFFYDRRETTLVFIFTLVIFGILSYAAFMQRQGFPAVDVPVSTVSGVYFANDSKRVDQEVTEPVSEAVGELSEVESVTAQADANFFLVVVRFKEGVTSSQGNQLVREKIQNEQILPQSAQAEFNPINATKYADEYDLLVSVYQGENTSVEELTEAAERAAQELETRNGVARATVLEQIETGRDPRTGRTASQTRYFDRFGIRGDDGEFKIYPSISIGIVGEAGQDALELSDELKTALQELRNLPGNEGVQLSISADFAESISQQIESLERSLLEGLVVVLLVCFLLISWRASLTAAITMLVVMAVTLGILYATGNTLNTITLFALILSLGLIVDDTIIKVEAIDAAKAESRRKRDIMALAAKRVSLASVAGTVTTMLAFAPMLFIGGILGDFIRILPVTVIIGLSMSLLMSLILVPILARDIVLKKTPKPTKNPVLKLESFISHGLAKLVLVGKRSRIKGAIVGVFMLLIAVGMIAASIPLFSNLKFDIFPSTKDTNQLQVSMMFPQGSTVEQSRRTTAMVNDRVQDVLGDHLQRLTLRSSGSAMQATAYIDVTPFEERDETAPQLVEQLNAELSGIQTARVRASQIDVGPPEDELPFRVQVFSEDAEKSHALAEDITTYLQNRTVTRQNGTTAQIDRVELINSGRVVRVDGRQTAEVRAGFDAEDTSALVLAARDAVEDEFPPERVRSYGLAEDALQFDFGAETQNQESFSTLLIAFPVLLVAMYVLMVLQFKSFLQPLLIFVAIPFSFFGVALGLNLSDNPLSFFVMIGFLALIGIAVNNTILLTDYANQARVDGMGRFDAMAYAVQRRFRPLVTTSLTSVVALIPLTITDPFWEPLSLTIICGLLSSTFLVVLVFPYIYLAGEAMRVFGHKLWARELHPALQYSLDLLISPVRLIAHQLYVIFRHKYH